MRSVRYIAQREIVSAEISKQKREVRGNIDTFQLNHVLDIERLLFWTVLTARHHIANLTSRK